MLSVGLAAGVPISTPINWYPRGITWILGMKRGRSSCIVRFVKNGILNDPGR